MKIDEYMVRREAMLKACGPLQKGDVIEEVDPEETWATAGTFVSDLDPGTATLLKDGETRYYYRARVETWRRRRSAIGIHQATLDDRPVHLFWQNFDFHPPIVPPIGKEWLRPFTFSQPGQDMPQRRETIPTQDPSSSSSGARRAGQGHQGALAMSRQATDLLMALWSVSAFAWFCDFANGLPPKACHALAKKAVGALVALPIELDQEVRS